MPHKDDFDESTRSRIKAFLGPWPRALEAAGLKERKVVVKKTKKRKKAKTKSNLQWKNNEKIKEKSDNE